MNIPIQNNNWKKISLSDHSGWEDSDSEVSEPATNRNHQDQSNLIQSAKPTSLPIDPLSLTEFDPNEILFSKWSENYYSTMKSANRTEREIIDGLASLMPKDYRSAIEVFPKDSPWICYRKSIQELFLNQSHTLLTKKPYKEYQNFSDFFSDKLRLLNDFEMANETRKNIIYRILDDQFKNDVELSRINEMRLHEFGLSCIRVEKSLGLKCTNCGAATHTTSDCSKKMQRIEFALDDTFWMMIKKSFINLRRMRPLERIAFAFWFIVLAIALIGLFALIHLAISSLQQTYFPTCTCPAHSEVVPASDSIGARLEAMMKYLTEKFKLDNLQFIDNFNSLFR